MARPRSGLAVRLALSFVAVAVLAVAIGAALVVALGGHDINVMVQQRRTDLTRSLEVDAASTYSSGQPGWSDADLRPAVELASQSGADVAVLDNHGHIVASTIVDPTRAPGSSQTPITLDNTRIGTLIVRFNRRGLVASANNLRSSLTSAVIGAAGLAAVIALVSGLVVANRLTRPVDRLILAAHSMTDGDREARVGPLPAAPAELQHLGAAFDGMADTLVREEQVRRDVIADMAHEIRTPIAILQANTEALLDGVLEPTPEQTMSLHEEVIRLAVMVDDLQALASAEAAALDLHREHCDLAGIVARVIQAQEIQLRASGLILQQSLLPVAVYGDAARLHQVFTNILSNALKFTPAPGRVSVAVCATSESAWVEIADTGRGIAAADREHVFERFWRATQNDGVSGSGIGLAVVAELVKAHHGTVKIEDGDAGGTRFVVALPRA